MVHKLCELSLVYMKEQVKTLVSQAGDRAVLYSYGSDATSVLSRSRINFWLAGKRHVRVGKECPSLLIQRAFVKTESASGQAVVRCFFQPPLPLFKGTTAWHEFSAMCAFLPTIRQLGHKAIAVSHYVFDRAVYSALERLARQRHTLYYSMLAGGGQYIGAQRQRQIQRQ